MPTTSSSNPVARSGPRASRKERPFWRILHQGLPRQVRRRAIVGEHRLQVTLETRTPGSAGTRRPDHDRRAGLGTSGRARERLANERDELSKILSDDHRFARWTGVIARVGEARKARQKNLEFEAAALPSVRRTIELATPRGLVPDHDEGRAHRARGRRGRHARRLDDSPCDDHDDNASARRPRARSGSRQKSAPAGRYLDRLGAYDSPTWRGVAGKKP